MSDLIELLFGIAHTAFKFLSEIIAGMVPSSGLSGIAGEETASRQKAGEQN